jgi:HlyD family secretion protein
MENILGKLRTTNRAVLIGAAVLIVLIIGAVIILTSGAPRSNQVLVGPDPVRVTTGDLTDAVTASGRLLPRRSASLAVAAPGIVTEVNVKVGDVVKTGTALIQLDDAIAKQTLAKAQTAADLAQVKLDMAQHDLDNRINWSPNGFQVNAAVSQVGNATAAVQAAQSQYDKVAFLPSVSSTQQSLALQTATNNLNQAQANLNYLITNRPDLKIAQDNVKAAQLGLDAAKIDLATAQSALDKLTLTAPFDGTITLVNVEVGESAIGSVVEIATMDDLEVVMDVDEVDVGALKVGQPTTLTFDTYPGIGVSGEVTSIAPAANSTANVVNYEVHLSIGKTDLELRAGMTVTAVVETLNLTDVLIVPNAAVGRSDDGQYFVVVATPSGPQKTEVTIGASSHLYTQILSGVKEGAELDLSSPLVIGSAP